LSVAVAVAVLVITQPLVVAAQAAFSTQLHNQLELLLKP
jgi:hypothetical protein